MIEISEERNDPEGVAYWQYALDLVETLGVAGMSDEEEGVRETQFANGGMRTENVNRVLSLDWRHPEIRPFLEGVDQTKGLEATIFRRGKREAIPRVRVEEEGKRPPPTRLPQGVFDEDYLKRQPTYRIDNLRMSDRVFEVRSAQL